MLIGLGRCRLCSSKRAPCDVAVPWFWRHPRRPLPAARRASAKPGQVAKFPAAVCFHLLDVVTTYLTYPTPSIGHSISLMLRTSLRSVRGLSSRSVAAASSHQWQAAAAARPAGLVARVSLAYGHESCYQLDSTSDLCIVHRDTLPTKRLPPRKSLNHQPQRQTRRLQAKHPLHRSRTKSTQKAYPPRTCP